MRGSVTIHPEDNVSVLLTPQNGIPAGHKVARRPIAPGERVIKYGMPIGEATAAIAEGEHVHTHNMRTLLAERGEYHYDARNTDSALSDTAAPSDGGSFLGYLCPDGRAGIRSEIWILPTVGCVNRVAGQIASLASGDPVVRELLASGKLDGIHAFAHPYGCSQLGGDKDQTEQILADLAMHPNAGGVLLLGLGCENSGVDAVLSRTEPASRSRIRTLIAQEIPDEMSEGVRIIRELALAAADRCREPLPLRLLTIGLKCGGSDGLSGITANPLVGRITDRLVRSSSRAVLTEVPEMFGAEEVLFRRCVSEEVFRKAARMIDDFKDYFLRHGEPVSENPSPGNRAGGITTLEEKSLGCIQKAGTAPITDVLPYGGRVVSPASAGSGVILLSAPGNDLVASTALAAAGAQLILFTTGRGTPFGAPVPTIKISSNRALAEKKAGWIDFDAGQALEANPADLESDLFRLILDTASGRETVSERMNYRDLAIWKGGVTL